jgi:hypothetical protein
MWGKEYIDGLEAFLRSRQVKTVLDVAGGTGFPSIELKKRGWDITYADADQQMLDYFSVALRKQRLNIPSLIYVDSWGKDGLSAGTRMNVQKALDAFNAMLNPNGVLYVDLTHDREFNQPSYPIVEQFGSTMISGETIQLTWELTHDSENHIRTWKVIVSRNGVQQEFINQSYLLRHEELLLLMQRAGFKDVERTKIPGEQNYAVFSGERR